MRNCEACGCQRCNIIFDALLHECELNDIRTNWKYQLLECPECGLGFMDPTPPPEIIRTFYDSSYGPYCHARLNPNRESQSIKYWIAKQRYACFSAKNLWNLIQTAIGMSGEYLSGKTISFNLGIPLQLSKTARIFELGYGSGNWLLGMAHLGYQRLAGFDIDSNEENTFRLKAAGIEVSSGNFLENDYPDSSFDCIRLEHVFEHLTNPVEVLAKCRRMLKPGGWLLINSPCKESWSVKLSFKHFSHLDLPRHLFHHTPHSAALILEAAGLEISRIKTYGVMAAFGSTLNNYLREGGKKTIPSALFYPISPLYSFFSNITGKGDNLTILSRRPVNVTET